MYSYTTLYASLINRRRQQIAQPGRRFLLLFVSLGWLLTLLLVAFNPGSWLLLLGVGVALSLLWVGTISLLWLLYLVWAGSHDPLREANRMAARLLLAERSLRTEARGLTQDELSQLRQVAEIEQAAADWRGNFINLVIVGLLFGAVSLWLNPPTAWPQWQAAMQAAAETPVTIVSPFTSIVIPPLLSVMLDSVSFIVMGSLLLIVLYRLATYFGHFVGAEASNRLILLACAEAAAILATHGESPSLVRSLTEKRRLARLLGFRLRGTFVHTLRTPLFVDESGRAWHLEPVDGSFSLRRRFHDWWEQFFLQQRQKTKP